MTRTQRAMGVKATPREIELRVNVGQSIEAALKAKHPPTLPFYHFLAQRDVVAIAVAMLVPSGLPGVVPHTSERLMPFRLANLFRAIPIEQTAAPVVSVETLRAQGTAEARRALACIPSGLKWSQATREERRLWMAAAFLRARGCAS